MNEIDKAAQSADNLLELLIRHQSEFIKPPSGVLTEHHGKATGDFIAGLRTRLIDMYNLKAHG